MLVSIVSSETSKTTTVDLDITEAQLIRWRGGENLWDVFPDMKPEHREFLVSGIYPNEWNDVVPDNNDDIYGDPYATHPSGNFNIIEN